VASTKFCCFNNLVFRFLIADTNPQNLVVDTAFLERLSFFWRKNCSGVFFVDAGSGFVAFNNPIAVLTNKLL